MPGQWRRRADDREESRQPRLECGAVAVTRGRCVDVARGGRLPNASMSAGPGARFGQQRAGNCGERRRKEPRVAAWIERQPVLSIEKRECAVSRVVRDPEFAALEFAAIVIAEDRNEHFAGKIRIDRMPVDVEVVGERRRLAVLQDVHPPRIVAAHDRDVVWHDIRDLAHAMARELGCEALEILAAADLRVEGAVIDDVVTVAAAGASAQVWRAIDVTHAQRGEIRHQFGRPRKIEIAVQLQAVRRSARLVGSRSACR